MTYVLTLFHSFAIMCIVNSQAKSEYLQLRISPLLKKSIQQSARQAGMGMSEWIIMRLFPPAQEEFAQLVKLLVGSKDLKSVYAELHDFFHRLSPLEFERAVSSLPPVSSLSPLQQNYITAMLETAAHQKGIHAPNWVNDISPLEEPYFGSSLMSLRLYLLTASPLSFRRRNIFIDATIGDRV